MFFNVILRNKVSKTFILFWGGFFIVVLWYAEKTKLIPQYGKVFYEMGLHCGNKCGQDKQLQYYQRAVRHDPNLSGAHYQLAINYEKMGSHAKALESYKRSTEFDSENTLAHYKIGMYYFRKGDYEHALRYFLQSHSQGRYLDDIDYYLARIYDQKKEYDLAVGHYHSIVMIHNEYAVEVYPRLAEIYHLFYEEEAMTMKLHRLRAAHRDDLADQLEGYFKAVGASEAFGKK